MVSVSRWFCPLLEPFIAGAAFATTKMRCYGCVAHGTSRLHHSIRSLRDLHRLGAFGPRCVNLEETTKMRCYGCVAHGTSRLHHSIRSLRDLH